jgi:hypothetical protein
MKSGGQSWTAAFSAIAAGAALSAFLIFHSSECWDELSTPGGRGSTGEMSSTPGPEEVTMPGGGAFGDGASGGFGDAAALADTARRPKKSTWELFIGSVLR